MLGFLTVFSAQGLYQLQRRVDRLGNFDGVIQHLHEGRRDLGMAVRGMEMAWRRSMHPRPGTAEEGWGGAYRDEQDRYGQEGYAVLSALAEYGQNQPLLGRRIREELTAPFDIEGYEDLPPEAWKLAWARDHISDIITRLGNQAIANR